MEESFAGWRVTVMGLGTFGGGIAATRFFADRGAEVLVTDLRSRDQLDDAVQQVRDLPAVRLCLGQHRADDFRDADLVVASPAVKPANEYLSLARQSGAEITTELRLFWQRCRAPLIGVTGSNGKSTTARLIYDILRADGRTVWLGGNIGRSLLPNLGDIQADHWVVLELSSFQLADLDAYQLSPDVAVITNITPNHLDWHGSFAEYEFAKQTILRWQRPTDLVVRHADDVTAGWPAVARCCYCGPSSAPGVSVRTDEHCTQFTLEADGTTHRLANSRGLPTQEQRRNALLAATTGHALGVPSVSILQALNAFEGLPYRVQVVHDSAGLRYVNDSASTTPESTIAALASLGGSIVLIVGGSEKGSDLTALAEAIVRCARVAIVMGEVQASLLGAITACRSRLESQGERVLLERLTGAASLAAAVGEAQTQARWGETVLLSPGFASGRMFRNFVDRGDEYNRLVANSGES